MAPADHVAIDADALLLAAAQSQGDIEALLHLLEQQPEDWSRPEVAAAWVRAARHIGSQVVLGAHVLAGLQRAEVRLRRALRVGGLLLALQALLLLAYTCAWAIA